MTMYRIMPKENRMELFRSGKFATHHQEQDLEDWLEHNPDVLTDGEPLLVIRRQLGSPSSGTLDLLALDSDGNVVVIELKRGKAPRDAIAQALEYAAWVAGLSHEEIVAEAEHYSAPQTFAQRWADAFDSTDQEADDAATVLPADLRLNERQRIFLVVEGDDERTATVARYLRREGVDFNLVTFHYYRIDSGEEMIDFELTVGQDQDVATPPRAKVGRRRRSTEEATLARWSPELQGAYEQFRDRLQAAEPELLRLEPWDRNIIFRRQMRDESVYICSFAPDVDDASAAMVGIRKPSLAAYLDVATVVRDLESDGPEGMSLTKKSKRVMLTCEVGLVGQVAELIVRHVLQPLAEL
ncbi:MAG: DUF91 domain-containing protein [Candidatus Promineofilum sp.]|nr:DUF91 domain-containing protein [Promineifilum sp.]